VANLGIPLEGVQLRMRERIRHKTHTIAVLMRLCLGVLIRRELRDASVPNTLSPRSARVTNHASLRDPNPSFERYRVNTKLHRGVVFGDVVHRRFLDFEALRHIGLIPLRFNALI